MTNTVPLVSVLCMTYNHENFIEDAINGFLIQETNFPFEVLIHDDASTDSTAKIIKKYEKKYPNIIKPIYQIKNQYSKGLCPLWEYLYPKAKGKYIAICEGDDYWTDPLKLQKQVDYLEAHPEVVISSFDANIVDSDGNKISDSKLPINHHRDYSSQELLEGKAWLLTLNWVYRNINIGFIPERLKVINGDKFFTSILGQHGSSHHHTDINPSVYRMHKGGIWSSLDEENKLEAHINTYFWMYKYYKRIGNLEIAEVFYNKFNSLSNDLYVIKFNSFNKSIFYSGFSQISNAILDLKQKNYKYIIYGYGSLGKYISSMLDKNCIGFIDKNYKKLNRKNIFSPKDTKDLNYDYILISLLGREENIIEELVEKYHIDKDKIVIINGDSKYLL